MKILKIEKGCGYYSLKGGADWKSIDEIDKDGLLSLLDVFLANEVDIDEPDAATLTNQAHFIIYDSIYGKLQTLAENKQKFRDESQRLYLAEIRKYSQ